MHPADSNQSLRALPHHWHWGFIGNSARVIGTVPVRILRQVLLVIVRQMPVNPMETTRLLPSPVSTGRLSVDRKIDPSIDLRGQKDTFVATELPNNNCVCRCSVAFERLIQIFAPRSQVDQ